MRSDGRGCPYPDDHSSNHHSTAVERADLTRTMLSASVVRRDVCQDACVGGLIRPAPTVTSPAMPPGGGYAGNAGLLSSEDQQNMNSQLVECVPNFSEGRDLEKIKTITKEIETTAQVSLLDVDPGESTNRTVVTLIGTPEGVKEAAFKAIKKASEVLDMSKHQGAHSRIGATDVCPFVPVSGVTMEDCVQIAHEVAKRVAHELNIPVYLYEEAA